ncbi:MAG: formimidoylglutamate deiminase [Gammaproteobacteria bacterium]|nr:formimidoylglutamate deiminase [Gammaproteobacteria bacterium]
MRASTQGYRFDWVLLPRGWAQDVEVRVDQAGMIVALGESVAAEPARRVRGYVVPGMPNAHSHAFQRALAGKTEFRAHAKDSFWTWRSAMYRLANRLDEEQMRIIATQAYVEMLKAGYTSVAEFHYLHRPREAELSSPPRSWQALGEAARDAGIGFTLLPTLYQHADFGAAPLRAEQRRFQLDSERFVEELERRIAAERRAGSATQRTGAAFHSLRAVDAGTLREVAARLRAIDPQMPVHVHVAEQALEVRACQRATGARPIELLLRTGALDDRWCLVHCTHANREELAAIASSGAVICIATTTEANLGDGFFDARAYARAGGRWCIGSDSHIGIDPSEELRWLEYEQRLRRRRRIALAGEEEPHVGTHLWRTAAQGGARALGQPVGEIAVGRRADWLVLDPDHPALAGASPQAALDHLVFGGGRAAIRDCVVAGQWVVADGRHALEQPSSGAFSALMQRLAAP